MVEGEKLGRYHVLTKLSVGGMAELYLAYFTGPGGFKKFVALKRILPQLREDETLVAMFLDEARISAALSHANIAQVFELGESGQDFFIAMEFIEGLDLARIAQAVNRAGATLPIAFSNGVVRDACHALHYAHSFRSPSGRMLPVIHRDMSLRNVMVTYSGTTKVIDFGIAKALGERSSTSPGFVKGSSGYMSPEQIRGEDVGPASDLFGVGAVLYELLTGKRSFAGEAPTTIMYKVLNETPADPRTFNPEVPEALAQVVLRALEKDPKKRFENGRAMAKAIEEAAACSTEHERAVWLETTFAAEIDRMRKVQALAEETDDERLVAAAGALSKDVGSGTVKGADVATEPRMMQPLVSPPPPAPARGPGTVLVVDDSRVGRMLVANVLTAEGYRVVDAQSGAEALEVLANMRPDAIVLDVRMPEMDGFELCERIRQMGELRRIPILFLSAACSIDERSRGLQVGGDDFLRKPFEAEDLVARVRAHLQRASMLHPRTTANG